MTPAKSSSCLPPVPAALRDRGADLRPEHPDDREFLRHLYRSTRWDELMQTGWPEPVRIAFLDQQFDLQSKSYRQQYPGAAFGIITLDTTPIGRLYLHQGPTDLRIMDLALCAPHRGQGIGAHLLQAAQDMARSAGTRASLHVEISNIRAISLYERLGFRIVENKGIYLKMDWPP